VLRRRLVLGCSEGSAPLATVNVERLLNTIGLHRVPDVGRARVRTRTPARATRRRDSRVAVMGGERACRTGAASLPRRGWAPPRRSSRTSRSSCAATQMRSRSRVPAAPIRLCPDSIPASLSPTLRPATAFTRLRERRCSSFSPSAPHAPEVVPMHRMTPSSRGALLLFVHCECLPAAVGDACIAPPIWVLRSPREPKDPRTARFRGAALDLRGPQLCHFAWPDTDHGGGYVPRRSARVRPFSARSASALRSHGADHRAAGDRVA
jgi:hypothetical protein